MERGPRSNKAGSLLKFIERRLERIPQNLSMCCQSKLNHELETKALYNCTYIYIYIYIYIYGNVRLSRARLRTNKKTAIRRRAGAGPMGQRAPQAHGAHGPIDPPWAHRAFNQACEAIVFACVIPRDIPILSNRHFSGHCQPYIYIYTSLLILKDASSAALGMPSKSCKLWKCRCVLVLLHVVALGCIWAMYYNWRTKFSNTLWETQRTGQTYVFLLLLSASRSRH